MPYVQVTSLPSAEIPLLLEPPLHRILHINIIYLLLRRHQSLPSATDTAPHSLPPRDARMPEPSWQPECYAETRCFFLWRQLPCWFAGNGWCQHFMNSLSTVTPLTPCLLCAICTCQQARLFSMPPFAAAATSVLRHCLPAHTPHCLLPARRQPSNADSVSDMSSEMPSQSQPPSFTLRTTFLRGLPISRAMFSRRDCRWLPF